MRQPKAAKYLEKINKKSNEKYIQTKERSDDSVYIFYESFLFIFSTRPRQESSKIKTPISSCSISIDI